MDLRYFFCPNKACSNHQMERNSKDWYRKKGFDYLKFRGTIQRFQCKDCGRTFSSSYFNMDFRCTHVISYAKMLSLLRSSCGIRAIAENLKCDPKVILNRCSRLAKKVMAVCSNFEKDLVLNENLCADGIENFLLSQFFPCHVNLLVGRSSEFIYYFNHHYFHRKGKMTEKQKQRSKVLYSKAYFEDKGPSKAFAVLLDEVEELISTNTFKTVLFDTDVHPIYKQQIAKYEGLAKIKHRTTSSKAPRDRNNQLFPCNYIDRQIRKDLAEYVRETTRFGKSRNNSMERMTLYCFYHNYQKKYRMKNLATKRKRHAQFVGFSQRDVKAIVKNVFDGRRPFYEKIEGLLKPFQRALWRRSLRNPLKNRSLGSF